MDGPRPTPEEVYRYRLEQLEVAFAALKLELHDEYLDKAQMMNEYVPRAEQARRQAEEREKESGTLSRLMLLATCGMTATSLISLVVAILHK